MFDPLVDSALIGVSGVVIGIFGYAFQNWQIKKAERIKAEDVAKREKYEKWITTFVRGFFERTGEMKVIPKTLRKEMNQANNLLMLYGSDEAVKAVCNLWANVAHQQEAIRHPERVRQLMQEILIAMRKDLVNTDLTAAEVQFLKV